MQRYKCDVYKLVLSCEKKIFLQQLLIYLMSKCPKFRFSKNKVNTNDTCIEREREREKKILISLKRCHRESSKGRDATVNPLLSRDTGIQCVYH